MKITSLVDLTCQALTELVTEYMHGGLTLEERVHFEQHLHACPWCMTYLAQMRRSIELSARAHPRDTRDTLVAPEDRAALLSTYRSWQGKRP